MQVKFRYIALWWDLGSDAALFLLLSLQREEWRRLGEFPRKALESGSAGGEIGARKM